MRCAPSRGLAGFLFQLRHLPHDSRRAPYDTGLRDLLRMVRDERARAAAVPPVGGPIGSARAHCRAAQLADVPLGVIVLAREPALNNHR